MKLLNQIGSWQFWLLLSGATIGCDGGAYVGAVFACVLLLSLTVLCLASYIMGAIHSQTTAQPGETTKD